MYISDSEMGYLSGDKDISRDYGYVLKNRIMKKIDEAEMDFRKILAIDSTHRGVVDVQERLKYMLQKLGRKIANNGKDE